MRSEFSKSWAFSKQKRKQVKYRANAPPHIRAKFLSAGLTKPLREKYGRSVPLRKGDEVKVLRGEFKGKIGKVEKVDRKSIRIQIAGLQRAKKSGEKLETWFHPSNVQIINLNLEDSKRLKKRRLGELKKSENSKEEKNAPKEE